MSAMVQSAAARALGRISPLAAIPALAEALKTLNPEVQLAAADALGRGKAPSAAPAVPALAEALRTFEPGGPTRGCGYSGADRPVGGAGGSGARGGAEDLEPGRPTDGCSRLGAAPLVEPAQFGVAGSPHRGPELSRRARHPWSGKGRPRGKRQNRTGYPHFWPVGAPKSPWTPTGRTLHALHKPDRSHAAYTCARPFACQRPAEVVFSAHFILPHSTFHHRHFWPLLREDRNASPSDGRRPGRRQHLPCALLEPRGDADEPHHPFARRTAGRSDHEFACARPASPRDARCVLRRARQDPGRSGHADLPAQRRPPGAGLSRQPRRGERGADGRGDHGARQALW